MTGTKTPSPTPTPTPILDALSSGKSRQILMQLVRSSPEIAVRAEELARELPEDVDSAMIAESLADDLSYPEIEDVWDTSGSTRDGYIEPCERAYEMLEEILDDYIEEMNRYLKRGLVDQSREYCAGILLGIHRFCEQSCSGLLEELPDFSEEADLIRQEWEDTVADERQIQLLSEYLLEKGMK